MPREDAPYPVIKHYIGIVEYKGRNFRTEIHADKASCWAARGHLWAELLDEKYLKKLNRMHLYKGQRIVDKPDPPGRD